MKGGTIVAVVDGTLRGNNSTGRADAAFLNVLKIKWMGGNARPNLIGLYSSPDKKVNGFNLSLNDAINLNAPQNISRFLDNMIDARESDASMHELHGRDVEPGHAYVYGLSKWLRHHYIPSQLPPRNQHKLTPEENVYWISVYTQEFINLYEIYEARNPLSPAEAAIGSHVVDTWRNFVTRSQAFRNVVTAQGGSKNRSRVRTRKSIRRKRAKRNTKKYRRIAKKHRKSR